MEVSDDVDFLDLACIVKIAPETVLDKLSGQINASFFDASNIAGTLKVKGLIDFSSTFPGPNGIVVTDKGKAYIAEAEAKTTAPFDSLDGDILRQLGAGKRITKELGPSLNIRQKDLALRIYKLSRQGLLIYELKNGNVELMLTESGFLKVKTLPGAQAQMPGSTPGAAQHGQSQAGMDPHGEENVRKAIKVRQMRTYAMVGIAVVVILFVVSLHFYGYV